MKRILPIFLITTLLFSACKKDKDDSGIDRNCGAVLYIDKTSVLNDGGIKEYISGSSCGQAFEYLKQQAELTGATIFYKGQTRAKVKYIVAKDSRSSNSITYVRYESNTIPDASIKHWQDAGYQVEVKELTGLEGANY